MECIFLEKEWRELVICIIKGFFDFGGKKYKERKE